MFRMNFQIRCRMQKYVWRWMGNGEREQFQDGKKSGRMLEKHAQQGAA